MHAAFKAWDPIHETLESVEDRIHDGVPREKLVDRGAGYAVRVLTAPTWLRLPPTATVVELGPGVGYVMQGVAAQAGLERITGLDVAPGMIAFAEARIRRDGLAPERFRFRHYDGVTFPLEDASVDLFYSVAAIQHIPKPYAYNALLEMHRCLKPGGTGVIQVQTWDFLPRHYLSFADEIRHQIRGDTTHWHHFYDEAEVEAVLTHGLHVTTRRIATEDCALWAAWRK